MNRSSPLLQIPFGVYALAAVALICYVTPLASSPPAFAEVKKYLIGAISIGAILFLLSWGKNLLSYLQVPKICIHIFVTICTLSLAGIIAAIATWFVKSVLDDAGFIHSAIPRVQPPPQLTIQPDTTKLPAQIFGEKTDELIPRQWEKYIVSGMRSLLNSTDVHLVYLVSDPFPPPGYHPFTLHLNVNTDKTILLFPFLARNDKGEVLLIPLAQADKRQGAQTEYRYKVTSSNTANDRIIIIMGMEKATYDSIRQQQKFTLSSSPLNL